MRSDDELPTAFERIGRPAVLKTAALGYDGKGQVRDRTGTTIRCRPGTRSAGARRCSRRSSISSARSRSIGARGVDGSIVASSTPIENVHRHHILDVSVAPADVPRGARARRRSRSTRAVLEALDYVGVLCIEFFVTRDGRLLINELAPRPHNSGHLTFDACRTSQFEQQLRAICGLPLGSPELLQPAAMANLLGDLWAGGEPDWAAALAHAGRQAAPVRKVRAAARAARWATSRPWPTRERGP